MTRLTTFSTALCAAALATATPFASASITGIASTDNSTTAPPTFLHQTSVSPVTTTGNTAAFTHTAQLLNQATFSGGVAQTNVGKSSYQIAFTVEDPTNAGFDLAVDQLMRGYSQVSVTAGRGDATGLSYFVQADDSTDAPGTFSNRLDLFLGTAGTSAVVDPGQPPATSRVLGEQSSSVAFGSYVGTTDFILDFTTFFSPTTNVFFQNQSVGSGEINYGLGSTLPTDDFSADELGHFVTVTATFIPEPATLSLVSLMSVALLRRR